MSLKHATILLLPILLFAGCSTVAKYEPKLTAGPAKPVDYPIYLYTEGEKVPRPYEIIGTMRVSDTPFTVIGGSLESVLSKLRTNARQKGADALQLTSMKSPSFESPNFGASANFLRFTKAWESVSLSEDELVAYLRASGQTLDPVEGIWLGNDPMQSRIGIMKNSSRPGRDFIAFILGTENPSWQKGDKKLELVRGERPGIYRGDYYQDDYRAIGVAFNLRASTINRFMVPASDDGPPTIFTRK